MLLDITLSLAPTLPTWPGDPKPSLERLQDMARGDVCTVTRLHSVVHAGTHLDAPLHFIDGGASVDSLALSTLIGPCQVVHVPDDIARLDAACLERLEIAACPRLLFRTRNSRLWDDPGHDFCRDFVAFSADGAQWLVDRGVRLVGIDYLSVEPFDHDEPVVHRILLGAAIIAVEGLDLRGADAGPWELICLPLKLPDSDGAPARVILRRN